MTKHAATQARYSYKIIVSTVDGTGHYRKSWNMINSHDRSVPWLLLGAELLGTALLVAVGLSIVILAFGLGSPIVELIPSSGMRRLITGFLFGTTGALIALSPLGKESGAHINPAVSLGFWLMGTLKTRLAAGYILAQLTGAVLGALPLLAWGKMGRSVMFGATLPGTGYGTYRALLGEMTTTFALVVGLFFFLRHHRLRPFTPALFPFLYAVMVFAEAPISGTSTNPARSLGPAVISGVWDDWWIYWVGPMLGTLLGVAVFRCTGLRHMTIDVAKICHFGHDRYGVFRPKEGGVVH
jgi:aquaporin Z